MKNYLYVAQIRTKLAIYEIARVIYESATIMQIEYVGANGKRHLDDVPMDHVKTIRRYVD